MRLTTKARNNIFLFHSYDQRDRSANSYAKFLFPKPPIEDLRFVSEGYLFEQLARFHTPLTKEEFFNLSTMVENPEDGAKMLLDIGGSSAMYEHVYLVIFELWRRLLPERKTISIICDEVDRQIFLYEQGSFARKKPLEMSLLSLEKLLKESEGLGNSRKKAREEIDAYMAHDLDDFLYDYISDLLFYRSFSLAAIWLERFYPFLYDQAWFSFLSAKILEEKDPAKGFSALEPVIHYLEEYPDLDLQLEILEFLAPRKATKLFFDLVEKTIFLLRKEEEFMELLEISAEFYEHLGKEEVQESLFHIMDSREKESKEPFSIKDEDFQKFVELLQLFR